MEIKLEELQIDYETLELKYEEALEEEKEEQSHDKALDDMSSKELKQQNQKLKNNLTKLTQVYQNDTNFYKKQITDLEDRIAELNEYKEKAKDVDMLLEVVDER